MLFVCRDIILFWLVGAIVSGPSYLANIKFLTELMLTTASGPFPLIETQSHQHYVMCCQGKMQNKIVGNIDTVFEAYKYVRYAQHIASVSRPENTLLHVHVPTVLSNKGIYPTLPPHTHPAHTTHRAHTHTVHTHTATHTAHTCTPEQQLESTTAELKESQDTVADLSRPPPEIPGADRQELLRLLDRRHHEILRLSEDWKSMASKLEVTSAAKSEFQTRSGLSCVCVCVYVCVCCARACVCVGGCVGVCVWVCGWVDVKTISQVYKP